jgi:ABC-2 type transport system permease protein
MKTNIFKQEFGMHARSVLTWSVALIAVIFVYVSMFSSLGQDAALLNEMLSRFPKELLTAFGMTGMDLSTILGLFGFAFFFVQVCLAIQAANYGFGLVSVEEREWTADFLLTKPVNRTQILTSKLLAAIAALTISNAVVWIASFVSLNLSKGGQTIPMRPLLLLLASIVVFQLFFLTVGLAISLLVKRVRSVTPYAMGLGFGMYVLSVFGDFLGESALELITPFKHFEPRTIIQNGAWNMPLALISVGVIVVAVAASYVLYNRRDIPAVV